MKWLFAAIYLVLVQMLHWYLRAHPSSGVILNTQGPWSLPLPNWVMVFIALVIIVAAVLVGYRYKLAWPLPLLFIIASGLSNLADRLRLGGVIDYIDLRVWPVFNVPDAVMTLAIIYFIISRTIRRSGQSAR